MIKTTWKFELDVLDTQDVEMPVESEVLSVQLQGRKLMMWALVNPNAGKAFREICINGTGHPVNHTGKFIDTFQLSGGNLIFHVFDNGFK